MWNESNMSGATAIPAYEPFLNTSVPLSSSAENSDFASASWEVVPDVASKRWPGWPGYNAFRLIVPVDMVGSIIGRKGEIIRKLCQETRASIHVLQSVFGATDQIVLVSAQEEPEAELSPAMDAVLRLFKLVTRASDAESDGTASAAGGYRHSIRLLVPSSQGISLIGKQGCLIKLIQAKSGATIKIISGVNVLAELPHYATLEENIVDIRGEYSEVVKALEAVVEHLRKFLVDHSVIPLFERIGNSTIPLSFPATQPGTRDGCSLSFETESLYLNREPSPESHYSPLLYGQDPAVVELYIPGLSRSAPSIVTQVTRTMQLPLVYAEKITGNRRANIAYIGRASGAKLTMQESKGMSGEIIVEIKGTSAQVQTAQRLIQDFIFNDKESTPSNMNIIGDMDTGSRSLESELGHNSFPPASMSTQSYGSYGTSDEGGRYNNNML